MTNVHNWDVGTLVSGQRAPKVNSPKIIYRVLHRTKNFVTLQKQDDRYCVCRKRPHLFDDQWTVFINGTVFSEMQSDVDCV